MASQNMMKLILTNNPVGLALSKNFAPAARNYATRALRNPVLKKQANLSATQGKPKLLPVAVVLGYLTFLPYPMVCLFQTILSEED